MAQKQEEDDKVRLDKWLWAARFTRPVHWPRPPLKAARCTGVVSAANRAKSPVWVMSCKFVSDSKSVQWRSKDFQLYAEAPGGAAAVCRNRAKHCQA